MKQIEAYDLLGDLGNVKPNITLSQLLMLSPECRRVLSFALVARKEVEHQSIAAMTTQAVDMSAPMVEVKISYYFILVRCIRFLKGGINIGSKRILHDTVE